MTAPRIAVTGATGRLGGRVARLLAQRGVGQRLLVRDPARAPTLPGAEAAVAAYDDGDAMLAALTGVEVLLLVSATEHPDRVRLHRRAIDAAVDAGVQRIVYTSFAAAAADTTFTFGRDHWHTEQHLRSSGVRWTALRDNMYADYLPAMAGADGVVRGPAGDGRAGFVARDDCAEAAAAALLLDTATAEQTYTLTGPEALTLGEATAVVAGVTGRPLRYEAETLEEAYASRAHYGAPDWEVAGWVTSYAAIAAGDLDLVTTDVTELTGHAATPLAEVAARWDARSPPA